MLAEGRRPLLYGEAGVGKTAVARAAAAASGRELFEAGSLATLTWLPYLPFRRLLGREPKGDSAHVAAEVEAAVGDGVLFLDDVHWADRDTRAVVALLTDRLDIVTAAPRGPESAENPHRGRRLLRAPPEWGSRPCRQAVEALDEALRQRACERHGRVVLSSGGRRAPR